MTIEKLLNGIGIKIFIEYFHDFSNDNLETNDLIDILPHTYTEKSRKSRISKAKMIIKENRLQEALNHIINSHRIDSLLKEKAKDVLLENTIIYPDEVSNIEFIEGNSKKVFVNIYERNNEAKRICLKEHGYTCFVCQFNFENIYGDLGKNFIHVHHLKPLSEIKEAYKINPIDDLCPVCPNCHAMLHKRNPPYSIDELKNIIANNKNI